MARFTIDGRQFSGRNVQIFNGAVTIDGQRLDDSVSGVVEIRVLEGTIENLTTDASISCGNVKGSVRAGGSVSCDDVGGSVSAGGSVSCDDVGGSVAAGGSIRHG